MIIPGLLGIPVAFLLHASAATIGTLSSATSCRRCSAAAAGAQVPSYMNDGFPTEVAGNRRPRFCYHLGTISAVWCRRALLFCLN